MWRSRLRFRIVRVWLGHTGDDSKASAMVLWLDSFASATVDKCIDRVYAGVVAFAVFRKS